MTTATATQNSKADIVGNRAVKPQVRPIDEGAIPEELKSTHRWVGWRWIWEKKWTKVPVVARTGRNGSSTNSATWCPHKEAIAAVQVGRCDGIGFTLGEADGGVNFAGIDLDGYRDPTTGDLNEVARAAVALFGSYAEVSPTGTGIKILCRGKLPRGRRQSEDGSIECYDSGRFFTVTGHVVDGAPRELRDATAELEQFHQAFVESPPKNETGLSDREMAVAALNGLGAARADRYHDWILVGMALKSVDDSLLSEWESWSRRSEKYVAGECAKKWASFRRGGVGIGSLIYWAKQDGWLPPRKKSTTRPLTDYGNAERFAEQHGAAVRYCHPWCKWLVWDGRCWAIDASGEVMRRAKRTARSIYSEAAEVEDSGTAKALAKFAASCEKRDRLAAMIALAKSEQPIPTAVDRLDAEPWLLNCENGTLDLRTGELREHRREDFLTKICSVGYPSEHGDAPLWRSFLERTFASNAALIEYIQRLIGMALVGEVFENVLPILCGKGANGKSVFVETICGMLGGDYAMMASSSLLMADGYMRHPTERCDLHGRRFVAASESGESARLSEDTVKVLTSREPIRARRCREDFWEFKPSHTLVLATNHKPVIRGTDHGIWRRIQLVPFNVVIPEAEQDKSLAAKLQNEWPAILRWAVAGCLEWQRSGLQPPSDVLVATEAYRTSQDVLGEFLADCCVVGPGLKSGATDLFNRYRHWAESRGEKCITRTSFGLQLSDRGFEKKRGNDGAIEYLGLGL